MFGILSFYVQCLLACAFYCFDGDRQVDILAAYLYKYVSCDLQLLEKVWDYCNMIRIYTKPKGQIPDYNEPVILHDTNPSLEQFCNRIHKVRMDILCGAQLLTRSDARIDCCCCCVLLITSHEELLHTGY